MTLDKALELSKKVVASLRNHKFIDHADAVALCREALTAVKNARKTGNWDWISELPGETKG